MVCKECGTYNAENLTHCRVCAAKLREDDVPAAEPAREEGKPSRDFVKPPSWPTHAFTGAPENQPLSQASAAPTGSIRPTIPPRAAAPETVSCPNCGKSALADAPFCPYCGTRITKQSETDAAPAAVPGTRATARPMSAAVKPAPQARPAADYDDDDDDYDDDDEDDTPKRASKKQLAKRSPHEFEDYDDDGDDDDYDEEFDDMPHKKGKGTTALFWGLIVLLLALIAVFGMYIAKKNFGGDVGKMFASIGSIFNKDGGDAVDPAATGTGDTTDDSAMYTASITEETNPETGEESFLIDIHAPTGSVVRIVTEAALTSDTVTVPTNDHVMLNIPRDVFMPNKPVESEVVVITPNLQAVSPDGEVRQITVPEITVTVPTLTMSLTEPAADTVSAGFNSAPIAIVGQVGNYDNEIAVFINDEQVYVDSTGMFTSSYTPKATVVTQPVATANPAADDTAADDAADDAADAADDAAADDAGDGEDVVNDVGTVSEGAETITIEARKSNCVTARRVIVVEPYTMQTMPLLITNDLKGLSSAEGSLTLSGTVTPGAKITATSASTDLTFGEASVSETGTFSLAVSIAKIGAYDITLTGKLDGYYDGSASAIVERPPSDTYKTFLKGCKKLDDNYDKIVAGSIVSGDFQGTGKVTEIISSEPYTVFKVQLSGGKEIVCVNRSAKSTINNSDVKEKKQVMGTLKGLYTDGKTPYLWVWFVLNK